MAHLEVNGSRLDVIEQGADRILAELGIRFQDDPETLDILAGAGGSVIGDILRLNGLDLINKARGRH